MERLDLKVGFDCNNKCHFCVQGKKRYKYPPKSLEELKNILEENRKNIDSVVFTGGEPTMHKNFLDLVRIAKDLDYKKIQIQTNGRMFSSMKFSEAVAEAGANEFSPGIHGPTPEIHDWLTQAPGAFKQAIRGVQNMKKLGVPVVVNSVLVRPNYRHLPQTARLMVALGVAQFQFAFVHALGTAAEQFQAMVPRKSLCEPYVKRGIDIGIHGGVNVMTEAIPYCFMEGYEQFVAERIIPRTRIIDAAVVVEDYTDYRWNEGKTKGPQCAECAYNDECEGPWKEYPEFFGWDEFKPRKTKLDVA